MERWRNEEQEIGRNEEQEIERNGEIREEHEKMRKLVVV